MAKSGDLVGGGAGGAGCLAQIYLDCIALQEQRQRIADVALAQRDAVVAGVAMDVRYLTCNFWRDARGNLLSPELEFISVASAFHGASDHEIAEVLWPRECRTERGVDAACAKVRQHRRTLHKRRIVVRYECSGCKSCAPESAESQAERAALDENDPVVAVVDGRRYRRSQWGQW